MSRNPEYDPEVCYECTGYGDDYYANEDGEMVCACDNCPNSPHYIGEDDDLD